jgi:hypothetical protein
MILIATAGALLVATLGLLAWLIAGGSKPKRLPGGRSPEEAAREAGEHMRQAIRSFERREGPDWLYETNLRLIQAMKLGHNDGEAAERLAINLETHGEPRQAMEICQLVLRPEYRLRKGSALGKEDFRKRLQRYREKHPQPPAGRPLFTPEEALDIVRASRFF